MRARKFSLQFVLQITHPFSCNKTVEFRMEVGGQLAGNLAVNFLLGKYGLATKKPSWRPTDRQLRELKLAAKWSAT